MDNQWAKDILNTRWNLPGIEHTFEVPWSALSNELRHLIDITPEDIFVFCQSRARCKYLMNQFVEHFAPQIIKLDKVNLTVQIGNEIYIFVDEYQLRMACKGRRSTRVVYETEFERALNTYQQTKGEK